MFSTPENEFFSLFYLIKRTDGWYSTLLGLQSPKCWTEQLSYLKTRMRSYILFDLNSPSFGFITFVLEFECRIKLVDWDSIGGDIDRGFFVSLLHVRRLAKFPQQTRFTSIFLSDHHQLHAIARSSVLTAQGLEELHDGRVTLWNNFGWWCL